MIEAGAIEAGVETKPDDLIALDDALMTVDPAVLETGLETELETGDFAEPVMIACEGPDCETSDNGMFDSGVTDLGLVEVVPFDDSITDDSITDDSVTDDSDMVFVTSELLDENEPTEGLGADGEPMRPSDPMPEWRTFGGAETEGSGGAETEDSTADDSELVGITLVIDKDVAVDDTGLIELGGEGEPGRPIDPMPEWRTLDGTVTEDVTEDATGDDSSLSETDSGTKGEPVEEAGPIEITLITDKDGSIDDTGSIDDGIDIGLDGSFEWTEEEFDVVTADGGPLPLETMDPNDPRIFQTFLPVDEAPGRGSDPQPFERTNADTDFTSPYKEEVEIDRTPVNYAAADTFNTGLDLL